MRRSFCSDDLASRKCSDGTDCTGLHLREVMSPRLASTIRALRKRNKPAFSRLLQTVKVLRKQLDHRRIYLTESKVANREIDIHPIEFIVPGKTTVDDQPYFVSLQADGEREIIVCERSTGKVYAQNVLRHCEPLGRCHEQQVAGYMLDAEKVTLPCGKTIHLAFDVLWASFSAASSLPWTQDDEFDGLCAKWRAPCSLPTMVHAYFAGCFEKVRPVQLWNSHRLLQHLVSESGIPNLLVKPIYPAAMATKVWSLGQKVPYPVDGLIFTFTPSNLLEDSPRLRECKWKPQNKHTIDVALGGGVGVPGGLVEFIPRLHDMITKNVSFDNVNNVVYDLHAQCAVVENGGKLLFQTVEEETQEAPSNQTESTNLLLPKVLVPEEQSSWAAHRIVEVHFNLATKQLEFVRVRFDKNKTADSFFMASDILAPQQQNSSPEVAAKLFFVENS